MSMAPDVSPKPQQSEFSQSAFLPEGIGVEELRKQLRRICLSEPFARSKRIQRFLDFLIEVLIAGDGERLKETVIGVAVFDRPPAYDPKRDAVVRVEARRLRTKLSEYYVGEGSNDPIVIALEKGGYVPYLRRRSGGSSVPAASLPEVERLLPDIVPLVEETGYAEIPSSQETLSDKPSAAPPPRNSSRASIPWRTFAIGGLLVVSLAVVAIYLTYLTRNAHGIINAEFTPTPLANELGIAATPSFSPGGQQIAFAWNGEKQDNFHIYVKMVGSPALFQLTNDSQVDFSPAWSPDGRFIAFCRGRLEGGSAIWITSPLGGPKRKIIDLNAPAVVAYRALTWTPDARALVYSDIFKAGRSAALFVADLGSGKKRQLTFPPPDSADVHPALAPDGHAAAFSRDTGSGVSHIHILPLNRDWSAAGTPKKMIWAGFENVGSSRPKWTPDSKQLVFISNRTGEHQLWKTKPERNATPEVIGSLGTNLEDSAISANGALAVVRMLKAVNIWKLDVDAVRRGKPVFPVRILASTRIQTNPTVSRDGSTLAFESNRSGFMEIWTANADGTGGTPLTTMRNPNTGSPSWSHNGKSIAFDSRATGTAAIYVMPADGGTPTALTKESSRDVVPNWSSDDKWIFFTSDRSGASQIWKVASGGGAPQQVTHQGGFAAAASPDGLFLYYSADRLPGTSLKRMDLRTGSETLIARAVLPRKYFPTKDGVFYLVGDPYRNQSLMFYSTRSRSVELLAKFDRPIDEGIGLSPDGSKLFYGQVDQDGSELLLVDKFWH